MRFIGDVHGKIAEYLAIVSDCNDSVQVGDFGAGFVNLPLLDLTHRFIRGNHDNPAICREHPNWIEDGYFSNGVMFIGGAYSVDQAFRTIGVDWWPDEELGWQELDSIIDSVENLRPEIIISHDCPFTVALDICSKQNRSFFGKTRTAVALNCILDNFPPKLWIFGHWHVSYRSVIKNTNFICLNELEYIDV